MMRVSERVKRHSSMSLSISKNWTHRTTRIASTMRKLLDWYEKCLERHRDYTGSKVTVSIVNKFFPNFERFLFFFGGVKITFWTFFIQFLRNKILQHLTEHNSFFLQKKIGKFVGRFYSLLLS